MTVRQPMLRLLLVAAHVARGSTDHTDGEQACLRRWVAGRRRVVELGVADGVGTTIFKAAMAADGVVHAVDPYPAGRLGFSAHRAIAHLQVRRTPGATVRWIELPADEAADVLAADGPFDFVFSDAAFAYHDLDRVWRAWRSLVAAGGIWIQSTSREVEGRADAEHDTVRWTRDVLAHDPSFSVVDEVGTFTVAQRHAAST